MLSVIAQLRRSGFRLRKNLVVDEQRGLLLVFQSNKQRARELPLTQLIQIEKSLVDSLQVHLIFSSQGVPFDEEEALGGLERVLRILFRNDRKRDEFLELIMKTQATLNAEFDRE